MSSLYVRELCEVWATGQAVPYFNTISEEQKPDAPMWFTLEFQAISTTQETYCATKEIGEVILVFMGTAGIAYNDLMAAAEPVVKAFYDRVDPSGRLTLEQVGSPADYAALDAPWYGVEWPVTYTFR